MKKNNYKKGMLVLSIATGLVFVSIIFASLMNRMRQETILTNKVSVNERLNQLACAVGRISIRKLQRDIEILNNTIDPNSEDFGANGQQIINDIQNHGVSVCENFEDVINRLPVIKELKNKFKEKWGSQGEINTFTVKYEIKFDGSHDIGLDGVINPTSLNNDCFNKKGVADVTVTIGLKYGTKRSYKIRKELVFARLLAPPFCRYTLFSHNGANIDDNIANHSEFDSDGVIQNDKKPMVCLNQRLNQRNRSGRDYTQNPSNVVQNADSFINNGWIYLGGNGKSTDTEKESGKLILNIVPGSGDDELKTKFGEFFHFYFNPKNAGWLTIDNWSQSLEQWVADDYKDLYGVSTSEKANISFVNYGIYNDLINIQFAQSILDNYFLFKDVPRIYSETTGVSNSSNSLTQTKALSSSMHLFGSPKQCTPTLIFGKVQRRYLRAFGIYYPNMSRVFPLKAVSDKDELDNLFSTDIQEWYQNKKGDTDESRKFSGALAHTLGNKLGCVSGSDELSAFEHFYNKFELDGQTYVGIGPRIVDQEPYMNALINMCQPTNPSNTNIHKNKFFDKPEDLADTTLYDFGQNEDRTKQALFKGKFEDIKIDYKKGNYLKNAITYTLPVPVDPDTNARKPFKISDSGFMQDHFFDNESSKKYFMLNQVISINGDVIIDEPLICRQGGVIISSGSVTIEAPIINKFIEDGPDNNTSNTFGFLTIIARDGIIIKDEALSSEYSSNGDLYRLEAFLIAGCGKTTTSSITIDSSKRARIIGGVAADKIDDLVKKGCVIEWGFDQNYLLQNYNTKEFCGLTIGPRDLEIYTSAE